MFQALRSLVTSLAIASAIGSAAQAYASTSTAAHPGNAEITTAGLAIQNVRYETSGDVVQAVSFRTGSPSASLRIRLNEAAAWIPCSNSGGSVRCPTGNFPASAVEELAVVAS